MLELIRLKTEDFELSIWCREESLQTRRDTFEQMLSNRGRTADTTAICFSPSLILIEEPITYKTEETKEIGEYSTLELEKPLFFEHVHYQIEWTFRKGVTSAKLKHRLKQVNENFRFISGKSSAPRLTGSIGTRNDLGWFRLPLHYIVDGVEHHTTLSFEVLPTKMDLHADLPIMYEK